MIGLQLISPPSHPNRQGPGPVEAPRGNRGLSQWFPAGEWDVPSGRNSERSRARSASTTSIFITM